MARLVAITGCNRGYGRALAVELSRAWKNADLLLSQRPSSTGMDETVKEVQAARPGTTVLPWEIDMSNAADVVAASTKDIFASTLAGGKYDEVLLIHNAGTLGSVEFKTSELTPQAIAENTTVNITSFSIVNSTFLSVVKSLEQAPKKVTIVNISTLCAVQAFEGFNLYCGGKAARDMIMKVTALDHADVRVLNWAPGPMPTDMVADIREKHINKGIRDFYTSLVNDKKIVNPHDSATELSILLDEDKYESGEHLDYYDVAEARKKAEQK